MFLKLLACFCVHFWLKLSCAAQGVIGFCVVGWINCERLLPGIRWQYKQNSNNKFPSKKVLIIKLILVCGVVCDNLHSNTKVKPSD